MQQARRQSSRMGLTGGASKQECCGMQHVTSFDFLVFASFHASLKVNKLKQMGFIPSGIVLVCNYHDVYICMQVLYTCVSAILLYYIPQPCIAISSICGSVYIYPIPCCLHCGLQLQFVVRSYLACSGLYICPPTTARTHAWRWSIVARR